MQNAKCKIPCHCEGACARDNLQCTWRHRTKIEEWLTPEIPTPVCALARNDTGFEIVRLFCEMQNAKFRVIARALAPVAISNVHSCTEPK